MEHDDDYYQEPQESQSDHGVKTEHNDNDDQELQDSTIKKETDDKQEKNEEEQHDTAPDDLEAAMDVCYGPRSGWYSLRDQKHVNHRHLQATSHWRPKSQITQNDHIFATTLTETIFTKYEMRNGIKKFGKTGVNAALKELKQLHNQKVIEPRSAMELTPEEKSAALAYLMFLKEKRTGEIKGRGCTDGRKQCL